MNRNDFPAPNAFCEICGRAYHRCKRCIELRNRGIDSWRLHCDTVECYQTYVYLSDSKFDKTLLKKIDDIVLPNGRTILPEVLNSIERDDTDSPNEQKKGAKEKNVK